MRSKDVAPPELFAVFKGVFTDHLIKPGPLRDTIARLVPARDWKDLRVPLTVTIVDLDSGALVLCGTGHPRATTIIPLHDALYASCALPLYYPPLVVDGHRYSEGGLRAVLPLAAARAIPADLVVAVHVGPGFDETSPPGAPTKIPGLVRAYGDTIRILMAEQTEQAVAAWPKDAPRLVLVRPVHEKDATFAVEHATRYLEAGYEMTKAAL
jgi:NTE family protein